MRLHKNSIDFYFLQDHQFYGGTGLSSSTYKQVCSKLIAFFGWTAGFAAMLHLQTVDLAQFLVTLNKNYSFRLTFFDASRITIAIITLKGDIVIANQDHTVRATVNTVATSVTFFGIDQYDS